MPTTMDHSPTLLTINDLPSRPQALPTEDLRDVFGGGCNHEGGGCNEHKDCCGDLKCDAFYPPGTCE